MSNYKFKPKVFFCILPILAGVLFFVFSHKEDLQIYPAKVQIGYFSDEEKGGTTEIHYFDVKKDTISTSYTLNDGFQFPYYGIFFTKGHRHFYDLSDYDYLEVELKAERSRRIPIHIVLNVPEYTDTLDALSYRQMEQELDYSISQNTYRLYIDEFKTPAWWFMVRKVTESEIGKPLYERVNSFNIQNCQLLSPGERENIDIYRITCKKDNLKAGVYGTTITLVLYTVIFLTIRLRKLPENVVNLKQLSVGNQSDEEAEKILTYIAHHYPNTALNQETIQKELGFSEAKISNLIKTYTNTTFKKYLNHIRLQEAKRLLTETDRQINDIAYKVGYSNVSHFNRVFKESEKCSPNEYRKKFTKTPSIPL
ncbi:AraC family transcriptional regulator [Cytophagaceae bacterium ABcell3]|nr:AraC family transcriptional regulator [Cytophagaceae bacterium ABcell3]